MPSVEKNSASETPNLDKIHIELPDYEVLWQPQEGKQTAFILCPVEDILYGGARGPGKSEGLIGKWMIHADQFGKYAHGLLVRRTMPQLANLIRRTQEIFPKLGAVFNINEKLWRHPEIGWTFQIGHLWDLKAAENYQGHEYTWIGVDEITNWPDLAPIDRLRATLRSPWGVPVQLCNTGNPGGPSHNQVKFRYIDQAPPMTPFKACARCDTALINDAKQCVHKASKAITRVYIPATLDDNPMLLENDPDYWSRVESSVGGDPALLKAWRDGDWSIIAGGMFDDLWNRAEPVIEPFKIPKNWYFDRTHDWGSSKPYCTLWFAESNGESIPWAGTGPGLRKFPAGTLFVIMEDYGWNGRANEGCNRDPRGIAQMVKRYEEETEIRKLVHPGPADLPQLTGGETVESLMAAEGVMWTKPVKGKGSRVSGWTAIRQMLLNNILHPFEKPGLYVFNTCPHLIRTIRALPRDQRKQDDVDTDSEDHAADALRMRVLNIKSVMKEIEITGI